MHPGSFVRRVLVVASILGWCSTAANKNVSKNGSSLPNIVILLADNLGYNDISLFGAPTAQTPHIDSIGRKGMKLNHWNSAAHLCSASRASLLTGQYPARLGIYPRVFHSDAVYGLPPNETTTLAEYLRNEHGYATMIVGKWHLGHRPPYLPTNQGFDEWLGIPYHMSGGSVDRHVCAYDDDETQWLPLYANDTIVQQPVSVQTLAHQYSQAAVRFLQRHQQMNKPHFLYMAFSHVHQLCAPKHGPEQAQCQWAKDENATFVHAVEEMDWIAGQILNQIGDDSNTIVLFTSDNGPWVAEQECAGSKGPFEGRWLMENAPWDCTACPGDYRASPTRDEPRRCLLESTQSSLTGVPCGADTGLGSVWEANLRMPALIQWPGTIQPGTESMESLSTLDVVPTILSLVGMLNHTIQETLDGMDFSPLLYGKKLDTSERVLFFWRDGFAEGPLPPPYGRNDVAAIKVGNLKGFFWTKSAHYNDDVEVYHDPPLLFDVLKDPAEAFALDPNQHAGLIDTMKRLVAEHKASIPPTFPYTLPTDPKYLPCADPNTNCRTTPLSNGETQAMVG